MLQRVNVSHHRTALQQLRVAPNANRFLEGKDTDGKELKPSIISIATRNGTLLPWMRNAELSGPRAAAVGWWTNSAAAALALAMRLRKGPRTRPNCGTRPRNDRPRPWTTRCRGQSSSRRHPSHCPPFPRRRLLFFPTNFLPFLAKRRP